MDFFLVVDNKSNPSSIYCVQAQKYITQYLSVFVYKEFEEKKTRMVYFQCIKEICESKSHKKLDTTSRKKF